MVCPDSDLVEEIGVQLSEFSSAVGNLQEALRQLRSSVRKSSNTQMAIVAADANELVCRSSRRVFLLIVMNWAYYEVSSQFSQPIEFLQIQRQAERVTADVVSELNSLNLDDAKLLDTIFAALNDAPPRRSL